MSDVGIFKCERCFKTYKNKNGRTPHHNAKNVVTETHNVEPTKCVTFIPIDEVKTVVNSVTVRYDNLT